MPRLAPVTAGALLAASLCCEASGPQQYTIQDLTPDGAGESLSGAALNTSIHVAGSVNLGPNVAVHAMIWSAGSVLDLATLGGQTSEGLGINDAGQVVGASQTSAGIDHAFLYRDGTMIDLGTLGGTTSAADGISCGGLIVGSAATTAGDTHGFLYGNGAMTDLGTLGGPDSRAFAINSAGQVVGYANTSIVGTPLPPAPPMPLVNLNHAFLYSAGVMQDLGILPGGTMSWGSAINALGDVVGTGDTATPNVIHAFLYSHGVMQDIGEPPGVPSSNQINVTGIDSADDVIGYAGSFTYIQGSLTQSTPHGFIYSQGPGWTDLNTLLDPNDPLTPYVVIITTTAINDQGVILSTGADRRVLGSHTYLLTPAVRPTQSANPAPCVDSIGSSSSSPSASSSSSTSGGPSGDPQAAYPPADASGPSGTTGGGGDFDALTLALLAAGVLRAAVSRQAVRRRA